MSHEYTNIDSTQEKPTNDSFSKGIRIIVAKAQPFKDIAYGQLGVSSIAINLKNMKRNEKRIFGSPKHGLVKPHESASLSHPYTYSLDLRPMH